MIKKEIVTYEMFGNLCDVLVQKIKKDPRKINGVCGIPRGGIGIALHLSHHLNIPYISDLSGIYLRHNDEYTLLCDDVSDTGKTLSNYLNVFNRLIIATLFYKPISTIFPDYFCVQTTNWIQFPWECDQSKTSKYHQEIYPDLVKREIHHYDAGNDDPDIMEFLDDISNGRSIE